MIKLFHAENFGCLKNVEFELTPLHAFIGPNDSGKTTLLKAIDGLAQYSGAQFRNGTPYLRYIPEGPGKVMLRAQDANGAVRKVGGSRGAVSLDPNVDVHLRSVHTDPATFEQALSRFVTELTGARMLRLDADALRQPSPLLSSG